MTLSSSASLTIHDELHVVVVSEPSLPPLANPKEKRVRSPSPARGVGKEKKSRRSSLPLNLVPSSSEVLNVESMVEVAAPLDLGIAISASTSKALEGKGKGPTTVEETPSQGSRVVMEVCQNDGGRT